MEGAVIVIAIINDGNDSNNKSIFLIVVDDTHIDNPRGHPSVKNLTRKRLFYRVVNLIFIIFSSSYLTFSFKVATIGATDADSSADNNNVVVFSLSSTEFTVDAATGVVTTVLALDREAHPR